MILRVVLTSEGVFLSLLCLLDYHSGVGGPEEIFSDVHKQKPKAYTLSFPSSYIVGLGICCLSKSHLLVL